jgi:hypothetical protein
MTSYIKILQKLDAFCTAHLQIKKFMGEFREQMPNFSTMDERYPIVFASPISDVEDLNTNQFTLEIYCVDIIQKDRANLNTIVSDCHLILKDLFIYYRDDNDADLDVVGTASISFVNNFDLDYVAGAVMTITFEVAGYGSCEIPMLPITPTHNDCEPATLIVRDSDNNVLYTLTVDSGATDTQVISDSTATLKDTADNVLSTTQILAEGSEDIVAPDATYTVEYLNGTPIQSGSIPSGGFQLIQVPNPITCADAVVNVNSVFFDNVASGGTLNIEVRKSSGSDLVGSKQGQYWRIADSTAVLKTTGGATISTTSIKAEESEDITAPDATVGNSDNTYTQTIASGATLVLPDITVTDSDGSTYTQPSVENVVCTLSPDTSLEVNGTPEGTFVAGSTIEVNITDGVNPVTPNDVTVVGDVVTIEVPSGGGGIDPDAQAYITANTAITSSADITAIDTFFKTLKSDGIYKDIHAMYLPIWGSATANKWNLKDPRDLDVAFRLQFFGGVTHASDGVVGNGSNGYAETYYSPSTSGNLGSGHLSFYSQTNLNRNEVEIGCRQSTPFTSFFFLQLRTFSGSSDAYIHENSFLAAAVADSRGFFIGNRGSTNYKNRWRNSTKIATANTSSTSLSTLNVFLLANNLNGSINEPSQKKCSFASIGEGFTDTQETRFFNAVQALMTHFGIQHT